MRPAFSLIVFTSLSGSGFGLAAILGLSLITTSDVIWQTIFNGTALMLIGIGVVSSTLHLGHPERAWRALTQWRSSWLSREGVLAGLTFGLISLYTLDAYFNDIPRYGLGVAIAVLSLITIWCTAMIYASLKTVARWHHPLTPFVFIGYAMTSGLILAVGLDTLANGTTSAITKSALTALVLSTAIDILWSRLAGTTGSGSSPESATGLGDFGPVRLLMPPHSEENWLQHEMGFVVARKHSRILRWISLIMSFFLPFLGLAVAADQIAVVVSAIILHTGGVMLSRWLFFAEAKHTVMLYY
jgi:DMSO reductase anchor subunit